jgi:hypothetical protein
MLQVLLIIVAVWLFSLVQPAAGSHGGGTSSQAGRNLYWHFSI